MPETTNKESYQPIAFDAIRIGLASPEKIREWSRGEVKKSGNHQLQNIETGKRRPVLRAYFRTEQRLGMPLR